MQLEVAQSLIGVVVGVTSLFLILLTLFAPRFRKHIARVIMSDFASLQTYSEMGKISGDVRLKEKVEGMMQNAMVDGIGKVFNNPVVGVILDYVMNKTQLGDMMREDERVIPIMLNVLGRWSKEAGGLDGMVDQLMSGFGGQGLPNPAQQDEAQQTEFW